MYGQRGSSDRTTVVHVAAWTSTGERIKKVWAVLSSLDGRSKFTENGRDVQLSVPTGEYILLVEAPGFEAQRQIIKAYGPEVLRTVALPIAKMHGQRTASLAGTIRNYDGDTSRLRVRVVSLYGNELREARIDERGSFSFPVDEGLYLLMTVADVEEGIAMIDSRAVRLSGQQTIEIDLRGKHAVLVSAH